MELKIVTRGFEQLQEYMKTVPRGAAKVALSGFKDWMIGADDRALRHYEKYRYITPFQSYSSDPKKAARQRGWIFTHLDEIGRENRKNNTKNSWKFKETNNGYGITLINDSEGAKWLWSDKKQTRQNAAVGHRTVSSKIQSNMAAAIRHASAAVNKWLRQK